MADIVKLSPQTKMRVDEEMAALDAGQQDRGNAAIPPVYSENRIARDFVSRHESQVRFVPEFGKWVVWTGAHWRRDDGGEVGGMIGTELARVSGEIIDDLSVAETARARERFARTVNTDKVRRGVEAFARTDWRIVVHADQLDCHDHLLNTPAGTVDLRSGHIHEHRREDLLTRITRVAPTSGAEIFSRFLVDVTLDDHALIQYLQRALGACLFGAGYNADHWLMFWYGVGRNAKNTLGDAVAWVLGSYAKTVPTTTLIADEHGSQHPTVTANLAGVRLAISSEIDEGARWSESRIKALTGDEVLSGRFMRQDFFEFRRTHRHLIYGNHRPLLSQPDPAITQRLHLVPFNADFAGDRGDPTMPAQLREESGAILQWLIAGAGAYHEDGGTLRKCPAVEAATNAYFEAQSTFDHWLAECTTPDLDGRTLARDLYQSFAQWKDDRGERALSQTRWGEEMGRRFKPYNSGGRGYVGIRLSR